MDEEERLDLGELSTEIENSIGHAMDVNARMMRVCRSKANKMFQIADELDLLADEYRRIGSLHVLAAKEHALCLADTIDAEYNISEEDVEDGEEDGIEEDADREEDDE